MSYKATNWAYELPLKGSPKPVLVALADMADEAGTCFPSQATLARMTGLGERTVRRAIEELESLELLKRVPRYGGVNGRMSDRYVLAVGSKLPANLTTGQPDHRPESHDLPANLSKATGHSGQGTINEPLLNHHIGEVVEAEVIDEGSTVAKPFPDEFQITPKMKEWAVKNVPHLNLTFETQEFVAYWKHGEGKGKKRKNWVMTWQNRMRQRHDWLPASEKQARKAKVYA